MAGRAGKQVMQNTPGSSPFFMGGYVERQAYNHINDKVHKFKGVIQRQKVRVELAKVNSKAICFV